MSTQIAVLAMLFVSALLVWGGMTGRLDPQTRTLRVPLHALLLCSLAFAGIVALAWLAIVSSLIF
jgi:hypothetical protein